MLPRLASNSWTQVIILSQPPNQLVQQTCAIMPGSYSILKELPRLPHKCKGLNSVPSSPAKKELFILFSTRNVLW